MLSGPLHLSPVYHSKLKEGKKEEPFSPSGRNWNPLPTEILALSTSEGQELKLSLLDHINIGMYKEKHSR